MTLSALRREIKARSRRARVHARASARVISAVPNFKSNLDGGERHKFFGRLTQREVLFSWSRNVTQSSSWSSLRSGLARGIFGAQLAFWRLENVDGMRSWLFRNSSDSSIGGPPRVGSACLSSGRSRGSSTCRLGAPSVRRYISRRRVKATADPRRTVALSPPRAALRHFRTRAKNPPERTSGGGVASPSLGTVVPNSRPSPSTSSPSPTTIAPRYSGAPCVCARLRGYATRRDAGNAKRSRLAAERANSDIDCAAPSSRSIYIITCRGARRGRRGARRE